MSKRCELCKKEFGAFSWENPWENREEGAYLLANNLEDDFWLLDRTYNVCCGCCLSNLDMAAKLSREDAEFVRDRSI